MAFSRNCSDNESVARAGPGRSAVERIQTSSRSSLLPFGVRDATARCIGKLAAAARADRTLAALVAVLALVLLIRLGTLGLYPLLDPSEARYAEMARRMATDGGWVTPWFAPGVPFWGKPPLAFWTQAGSMWLLGATAFAARLPAWLLHLATCALMIRLARQEGDARAGVLGAIVFSSSLLGVVASGAVLTDPALNFSAWLACYGFWRGAARGDRRGALWGFLGLGLGMLAKGPLVLLLCGVPAIAWTLFARRWAAWRHLPWLAGTGIVLLVAVPWYVVAELRTPGFVDYFFVGEHWNRFLVSNWAGDRYGTAHAQPHGAIWLFLIGALLPWSLLLPVLYTRRHALAQRRDYTAFLAAVALVTPAFFTLAGNVLWTYALPALSALSLLLGHALCAGTQRPRTLAALALVFPLGLLAVAADGRLLERSENQQAVVAQWQRRQDDTAGPLYYAPKRSFAAEFYSNGSARTADDAGDLPRDGWFYVAVKDSRKTAWAWPDGLRCDDAGRVSKTTLYRCAPAELRALEELAVRHAEVVAAPARR